MKYLLIAILFASCTKSEQKITCFESYNYVGKSHLDFTRTNEYPVKWQNSNNISTYNPLTGVITWVKRKGTFVGKNPAKLYNTDAHYKLICE
jgi:hypothetical protein